ncbi:hypothetical protein GCM10010517_25870 [Streptosporangium fragile]|uniref:NodB homology domain-containing protein n=1 Tax=Streptosporangium fragile TaxID=46186 RepID=A0ABN3VW15_9ACTN
MSPTLLEKLAAVRDSGNDGACTWSAVYPQVQGAPELTAELRRTVEAERARFLEEARRTGCDETGRKAPELNIDFSFLATAGDVIGVRLVILHLGDMTAGKATTSVWYDGATRKVVPASSLIDPNARDRLATAVKGTLAGRKGVDAQKLDSVVASLDPRAFDDLAFSAGGDLVVTFDEGVVGAATAGQVQVVLPRSTAQPLLSEFGRRAQGRAMEPEPGVTSSPSGTPTVEVVPTGTVTESARPQVNCRRVKCVALTFDDGPGPYTDKLLGYLAKYRARATFFVVGQNTVMSGAVVRRTAQAGHEIGGHSWSHRDLTKLTAADVRADLRRTEQAIRDATGVTPKIVRPPYGALNATVRKATNQPMILWSVDTEDWRYRNTSRVVRTAIKGAKPGSIILFHDIHATSVEAIPQVLRTLSARGYHFVTVSELFGGKPPKVAYSAQPPAGAKR